MRKHIIYLIILRFDNNSLIYSKNINNRKLESVFGIIIILCFNTDETIWYDYYTTIIYS